MHRFMVDRSKTSARKRRAARIIAQVSDP